MKDSESRQEPSNPRDIPSLDGLRAVSITLVVLAHTRILLPSPVANSGVFRYLVGGGLHGVEIFFLISGYLITSLLRREFEGAGKISVGRFYTRRALRIFPAFYVYLSVAAALWLAGIVPEDKSTFLSAATYTIIYHPHPVGWLLEHSWSLSVEEQFYLVWPLVAALALGRNIAMRVSLALFAAMPILRGLLVLLSGQPPSFHMRTMVNLSSIDMLTAGALLALAANQNTWRKFCQRWNTGWTAGTLALAGLLLIPYAGAKLLSGTPQVFSATIGFSGTAIAIAALIEYVVRSPRSPAGRVLNCRLMRRVGRISYSIYLWQQLVTLNPQRFGLLTYPLILLLGEASYRLAEAPGMRWRSRRFPSPLRGPRLRGSAPEAPELP